MPKGYAIFCESINDQRAYDAYAAKAVPTILARGGRIVTVEDKPEVIEGNWRRPRVIVLEFDSVDAAREWYMSSDYQSIVSERHAIADSDAVIVSGFETPR